MTASLRQFTPLQHIVSDFLLLLDLKYSSAKAFKYGNSEEHKELS